PFGVNGNASTTSLTTTPMIPGLGMVNGTTAPGAPGDATPRYDAKADGGVAAKQATAGAASSTGALAASNSAPVSRPASTSNPTNPATPSTATTMNPTTTTSAAAKSSGYPAPIAPPH
ncbi:hypothetical protein KC352_g30629, partial [Hortaea werneckii]